MKTYEETMRSVMDRAEKQIQKNKKRNRVIRTAAFACAFVLTATAAVFGVKAMMKPGIETPKSQYELSATEFAHTASIDNTTYESHKEFFLKATGTPTHIDPNAPKYATITIDGKEYTGEYQYTIEKTYIVEMQSDEHVYSGHEGDVEFSFSLNSQTGLFVQFNVYNEAFGQKKLDILLEVLPYIDDFESWINAIKDTIPEELAPLYQKYVDWKKSLGEPINVEKAAAVANEYAKQYLGNHIDEYFVESDYSNYRYYYKATRIIDGLKSADTLKLIIDNNSNLINIRTAYLGSFDGIESLPFSLEQADAIVTDIASERSKSIPGFTHYEFDSVTPIVLQDGRIGVVYKVIFKSQKGEHHESSHYDYLVTPNE